MKTDTVRPEDLAWRCHGCDGHLVVGQVTVSRVASTEQSD